MSEKNVQITINGTTVEVPNGMLLVEAAKVAGIDIPVFCYHPKLEPVGVCRMCMVEVEGMRKPVTACTLPVTDGMVVRTDTETVKTLQTGVLEFLLLNHPLDCPVCDKGGECPLQDQTYTYGPTVSRSLDPKQRKSKAVDLGNFIVLDQERCILCRRCTRFDNEISQENNLIVGERAHDAVITTAEGQRFDSYFSGNTIELCPVGALTSDLFRFKARPWDLAKVPSVCNGCSVGCNIRLDYRFGELMRVMSRENPATDGGWLCDRGRFNYKFVNGENRIKEPHVRREGKLVPVEWRPALEEVAEKVQQIIAEKGGRAIGIIGGGRLTNEEAYLLQKLARVGFQTNNVDYRVGQQLIASYGKYSGRQTDLDDADGILIVDTLVAERAPVLDLRIRKAGRRNARIVDVGTAFGWYRYEVKRFPALPGEVGDVLAGDDVFSELKDCRKVVAVWGGHDAHAGEATTALLDRLKKAGASVHLLILSEQNNSRGAEHAGVLPQLLPGGKVASDANARQQVEKVWGKKLPAADGMDTGAMLKAAAAGQLEMLVLVGANVMQTYPDTELVTEALKKTPYVVAIDLFETETASYADVLLPAAGFPAKTGAFTSLDGLVQTVDRAQETEFDTWTDGQIIVGLGQMLGVELLPAGGLDAELAALGMGLGKDGTLPGLDSRAVAEVLRTARRRSTMPGDGLVLIPVERLYAGGGTSYFDSEIAHARPKHEGYIHPADAAELQIEDGDYVTLEGAAHRITVQVRCQERVVRGTLQVPFGLPDLPVYRLQRGEEYTRVTLHRQVMEEVG